MADNLPVWASDRNDQAAGLSVTQRIRDDGDLVSRFQALRLPSLAHQFDGRSHFDSPLNGVGLRVLWIGHKHLNPTVRVGPLKIFHGADERELFCLIKHSARVMGKSSGRD